MNYFSTRGEGPLSFETAVMAGLARDGGLLLPDRTPDARPLLARWRALSYRALAVEIMSLFSDLPAGVLAAMVERSYAPFRHPEVTPVVAVGDLHVLELFHGPTLAFKDVALQFLGQLFDHFLTRSGRRLNILAATSGDTGSAAIHGVKGRAQMSITVLYPHGRVSPAQELQMTTVPDANVFCLAVEGRFDDCQSIVKALFRDLPLRDRLSLGAVNSINWARVLAQVVYYFYAAFRVMDRTGAARVRFAVPTGNFGDIFAGYVAVQMGLPVSRLVLATNENDILARFFTTGEYACGPVFATASPSMDIQVASNFERYLYYRMGGQADAVRRLMDEFGRHGRLVLAPGADGVVDPLFSAGACPTPDALATIRDWHARTGYLFDPHTAVGVSVARRFMDPAEPLICLATAHPAKFGQAIREATGRDDLAHHPILDALRGKTARRTLISASPDAVRAFLERALSA